ncbi:hypothetical protein PYW08_004778 [Mythimna loreyi]|uniref:Uncharacterized protein n=1 Tax=Mythimna loreyi TaxID=667449 RepID=A0ACC2QD34_9NEOP|nr:hypothetical protein PYW08_004778 [Mythimna loreyi]
MQNKKRKVVQSEGREMIASVYHFLKEEYDFTVSYQEPNSNLSNLRHIRHRTAQATGVSVRTVHRVLQEEKDLPRTPHATFKSPMKRRRKRDNKSNVDGYTAEVIRSTIRKFCIVNNQTPTLEKLKQIFQVKIGFNGGRDTLRSLLIKLGYHWRKTDHNRKVMVERYDVQAARLKYLKQIALYRSQERPVVYTHESYVKTTHVRSAGTEHGFIDNGSLVYEANSATGNYHSKINFDNYVKWLDEHLLPNVPAGSVIVLDAYHKVLAETPPTSASSRADMQRWLTAKQIPFDSDMRKVELYDIIKRQKSNFVTYKIDDYIKSKGFEVLRLPPHHPELNAMERIWRILKRYVAARTDEQNTVNTEELILESIENISSETWSNSFQSVLNTEAEYMTYYDTEFGFTLNLQDDSADDTVTEDSTSDSN